MEGVTTRHLQVHPGLEGFDEDLDALTALYQELQQCSADVAHPKLDFLTFACSAHWLGVLTELEVFTPTPVVEDKEKKEDSLTKQEKELREQKQLAKKHRKEMQKQKKREQKAAAKAARADYSTTNATASTSSQLDDAEAPASTATSSTSAPTDIPSVSCLS